MPHASALKLSRPRIPHSTPAERTELVPSAELLYLAPLHAMLSDAGRVRQANEDACGASPSLGAFVVCDGMGGAAAGEIASRLALESFLLSLSRVWPSPRTRIALSSTTESAPSGQHAPGSEVVAAHPRLQEAIRAANHAVFRYSQKSRSLRGMGTTLVALLVEPAAGADQPSKLWLAHVGDSRCYRLRGGILEPLTQDHSLVEEQIQAGLLSRVQAGSSPVRNIITRAVGSAPAVEPEIAGLTALPGDLYLLASDGLTRELDDAEIADILNRAQSQSHAGLEQACQALIDAANHKGGGDNITALLLAFPAPHSSSDPSTVP